MTTGEAYCSSWWLMTWMTGTRVRPRGVEEARQARHHRLDQVHRRAELSEEALLVAEVVLYVDGDDGGAAGRDLVDESLRAGPSHVLPGASSIATGSLGTVL